MNFKELNDKCPYIPPEQIEWLKNEISDDEYYYIICSHQSLSNDFMVGSHSRGIVNRKEIREVLERKNLNGRKVLFCMNDNDHGDAVKFIASESHKYGMQEQSIKKAGVIKYG